jgi:hypothetical protein
MESGDAVYQWQLSGKSKCQSMDLFFLLSSANAADGSIQIFIFLTLLVLTIAVCQIS